MVLGRRARGRAGPDPAHRGLRVAVWGAGPIAMAHAAAATGAGWRVVEAVADDHELEDATTAFGRLGVLVRRADEVRREGFASDPHLVVVVSGVTERAGDVAALRRAGHDVLVPPPLAVSGDGLGPATEGGPGRLLTAAPSLVAPAVSALLRRLPDIGRPEVVEVREVAPPAPDDPAGTVVPPGASAIAIAIAIGRAAGLPPLDADGAPATGTRRYRAGEAEVRCRAAWDPHRSAQLDVQVASATGVLRAELLPTPTLEHDGAPVPLPTPTATPPEVEVLGHVAMFRILADDLATGRDPLFDADLGVEITRLLVG